MPVTRRWSGRAHLTWASSQFLFLAYLVFILQWTVSSGLSWPGVLGGLLLWAFEVIAGLMAAAYLWELCDALGSEYWRRRVTPSLSNQLAVASQEHDGALPFVSLHVPAHNEPPEMVIETLQSLQHRSLRPRPAPRPRRRHRHPRPLGRPGLRRRRPRPRRPRRRPPHPPRRTFPFPASRRPKVLQPQGRTDVTAAGATVPSHNGRTTPEILTRGSTAASAPRGRTRPAGSRAPRGWRSARSRTPARGPGRRP
jgi:hypothetical protein